MDSVLLTNQRAGSIAPDLVARALRRLAEAGTVRQCEMVGNDTGDIAAAHPGARLVVLGGDGTVHVAVRELWDAGRLGDAELAVVPAGTGNDLARGIGLPLDIDAALDVAAGQALRQIDLVVGDDQVIVNAAHAGVGAEAARLAQPLKAVAGPAAYPIGAAAAGVKETGWQVTVTADGDRAYEGEALMVGVCNAPSIGGGTELCPGADPADGLLDLVVVGATGPLERARFGAELRRGEHPERGDVLTLRAHEVTVGGDPLQWDVDGELGDEQKGATWRVEPGAFRLAVPAR